MLKYSSMRWNILPSFPHIKNESFIKHFLWWRDYEETINQPTAPLLYKACLRWARATSITENYYKCVLHHWIACSISRGVRDDLQPCWWPGSSTWQNRICTELCPLICRPGALCYLSRWWLVHASIAYCSRHGPHRKTLLYRNCLIMPFIA